MKTGLAILGIVIVIALAVGGYYVLSSNGKGSNQPNIPYTSTVQYNTTTVAVAASSSSTSIPASSTIAQNTTKSSYTVIIESSASLGSYLANGSGYTLYYYTQDKQNSGTSSCNSGCVGAWPAFYSATLSLPSALNASSFNTITRSDGSKQLTYKGYPLYYFVQDKQSGQANGNGVGGFVVASTTLPPP